MTLGSPLVLLGISGQLCAGPSAQTPGRVLGGGAWAILNHQAKVIVVLEAGAAIESHGGQGGIVHLCCPVVGLAVTRGCPAMALLEKVYQTFKGFFISGDAVRLRSNVGCPICPHGFLAFVGVRVGQILAHRIHSSLEHTGHTAPENGGNLFKNKYKGFSFVICC